MVYHSVPDPNKTYPDHMSNHEIARFEIQNVTFTADGSLVANVEAIVTIFQTIEMKFTRDQMISQMRQQGNHFYYKNKKLHLDWVVMVPFIHFEKTTETRDLLE